MMVVVVCGAIGGGHDGGVGRVRAHLKSTQKSLNDDDDDDEDDASRRAARV